MITALLLLGLHWHNKRRLRYWFGISSTNFTW